MAIVPANPHTAEGSELVIDYPLADGDDEVVDENAYNEWGATICSRAAQNGGDGQLFITVSEGREGYIRIYSLYCVGRKL